MFQHLWFCIRISFMMIASSIFLMLHGFSGGLIPMPKRLSIKSVKNYLGRDSKGVDQKYKSFKVSIDKKTGQFLYTPRNLKEWEDNKC